MHFDETGNARGGLRQFGGGSRSLDNISDGTLRVVRLVRSQRAAANGQTFDMVTFPVNADEIVEVVSVMGAGPAAAATGKGEQRMSTFVRNGAGALAIRAASVSVGASGDVALAAVLITHVAVGNSIVIRATDGFGAIINWIVDVTFRAVRKS